MRIKLPKLNTVVCRTPCTSACQLVVVVDYYIQDKMFKLFVVAKNSRDDQSCLVPTDVAGTDVPCGCYWTC